MSTYEDRRNLGETHEEALEELPEPGPRVSGRELVEIGLGLVVMLAWWVILLWVLPVWVQS